MARKRIKVNHVYFRNIKWCGCSQYGNAKYSADMVLPDGNTISGKTATDGIGGAINNWKGYKEQVTKGFEGETWYRLVEKVTRYAYCEYHITANGNVIFDYITDEKKGA